MLVSSSNQMSITDRLTVIATRKFSPISSLIIMPKFRNSTPTQGHQPLPRDDLSLNRAVSSLGQEAYTNNVNEVGRLND